MNRDLVGRFVGGSPGGVLARLVVLSFVVGYVLDAVGISPFDIVSSFRRLTGRFYDIGFDTLAWAWRYFLIGAVIVFPVWLVVRAIKFSRRGGSKV